MSDKIIADAGHYTNENGEENFYLPTYTGKSLVGFVVSISSYIPKSPTTPIRLRCDYQNQFDNILVAGSVCRVIQPFSDVTQGHSMTVRCIKSNENFTLWQVMATEGAWQRIPL